jgi:hypothetical protein
MQIEQTLTLKIISIGLAPFSRQIASSFVLSLLNHSLFFYGGDIVVTAMGIAYNVIVLVGMPLQSIVLGLPRQVLCYIPLLIILPRIWGLNGVFYAMPVADDLSSLLTLYFITIELKHLVKV